MADRGKSNPVLFYIKAWMLFLWLGLTIVPQTAIAEEEIVLGAATSLAFLEGQESLNAVKLAVNEINARGGVRIGEKKYLLRVESVDLRGALPGVPVSQAVDSLEKLIVEKKVHALVIGPFRSEVLLGAMDMISAHRVPLLGAIAMSTASDAKILKDARYKYIFRVGLNAKYLVDYLINTMEFLRKRYGFKSVYIMNQDVAWTRTTASLMIRLYFDRTGWQILGVDHYPSGASDFSKGLARAEAKRAQIILPLFDTPTSANLVKQWHGMNGQALLCGFISPMVGPGAWDAFEGRITGALNVIFELGNISSIQWNPAIAFTRAYEKKYGQKIEAGHGPAPAYESVYILAGAIEAAGSLEPDDIVSALEKTDRIGVMGRIRFNRAHQVFFGDDPETDALACIFQWQQDGSRTIVYPLAIADGEIELPVPR
jgi:branched-chain amino acid transport system substrate-binding protein